MTPDDTTVAPENTAVAPAAYPVPEFAELARCSESHCWNLIKRGQLRVVKLGRRTLIPASEKARLFG